MACKRGGKLTNKPPRVLTDHSLPHLSTSPITQVATGKFIYTQLGYKSPPMFTIIWPLHLTNYTCPVATYAVRPILI